MNAPTVTTQDATAINATNCIGNGNVSDWLGGGDREYRGLAYMVGTSGDPTVEDGYVEEQVFGESTGAFSLEITGLSPGTSYRIRAWAMNQHSRTPVHNYYGYGTTVQITTGDLLTLSLSDSVALSDAVAKNISLKKADTVTAGDAFSRVVSYIRSQADALTLADDSVDHT